MIVRAALGALLALQAVAVASAAPPEQVVTVVAPQARPTKRMLFVVDASQSMTRSFSAALAAVRKVSSQPVDELNIGVIVFADFEEHLRWVYRGKRWAKLPDAKAVKAATAWLQRACVGTSTFVIPPLKDALADKASKLTIVLVSDGLFSESDPQVLKAIEKAQRKRVKAKLPRALIITYGVGRAGSAALNSQSTMAKIGRAGRGGFYR